MVIRMLKELTDNYKELSGNYNSMEKEIETINKDQEEKKNSTSEIKNIPEGEEKEQGIENLFEKVVTENFYNLMREKVIQVLKTQKVPTKRKGGIPQKTAK